MSSASAISQWGFAAPRRAAGGRVRADLALERLLDGELLAPGPDGDVRLLAADRDVGVGGVRDAEQEVLDLGLDVRELRVDRGDPLAGFDRARPQLRDLGAVGLRAALDRLADLLADAAFRSALSVSPSPRSWPAARVGCDRLIDDRRVLALVDRALADRVRVLAEPLQPDAHAAPPPGAAEPRAAARGRTRRRGVASSQPARGPFVRPRNAR